MPRKKAAEVEILPPEDNSSKQGRSKVVEAKHTIEFKAPHTIEEPVTGEDEDIEFDDESTPEDKPKKKRQSYREELRKKLRAQGVSPATRLTITIEKYAHSESVERGMWADREFCTKNLCTEEYVLDEGYMDLLKEWGPGTYRITLRLNGTVVDAFDKRVASPPRTTPIIQNVNPNDPNSPHVIVMQNGDGSQQQPYQPMTMKEIMKARREAMEEELKMRELERKYYGLAPETPTQQQPRSEEEILTSAILNRPEVLDSVVNNVMKRVGAKGGSGDDEPWFAGIIKDSITTGQLAPTVQAIVKGLFPNGLFGGFNNLFAGGQNNGPTQMGNPQQPVNHAPQPGGPMHQNQMHQITGEQHGAGLPPTQANEQAPVQSHNETNHAAPPQVTPEQHALSRLIQNCQRNVPVQVAFQQLINYADAVNEQAPDCSIDGYIDLLGSMPTDQVIEFVAKLPGGDQIAALPHAKEWCAELQRLIRESQEGDGE